MSPMHAARCDAKGLDSHCYQRHQPEHTLLYQIVEQHYPLFVTHMARQGRPLPVYVQRDAENSYLTSGAADEDPMTQLLGHSVTYRIAVGPQAGRKVFTLQTLPACDPEDQFGDMPGLVAGFSLHAGVVAKAHQRDKLERLCRYISRPAISEKRLSLTSGGNVRYDVKGFTNVAGAGMRKSDPAQDALP